MCLFLVIGAWRPRYALAAIFALAPFQNDISLGGPFRFSVAELNLLLGVPLLLIKGRQITVGATLLPAVAFLLCCFISSCVEWRSSALATILQTALYLIVAVIVFANLGRSEEDYRLALTGFVVTSTLLAVMTWIARSGYVLGMHKNGVGGALAAGFLIALELSFSARSSWTRSMYGVALFLLAGAEIISLSRGAWVASIAGTLVIFLLRREFKLVVRSGLIVVPVSLLVWQILPTEGREYAFGMSKDRENIRLRLESIDYAWSEFEEHPLLGAGTGLRKEYDATNIILLTLAETGLLGLISFAVLHLVAAGTIWTGHRGLPKSGFSFSIVVLAGALLFGRLAHGLVDHYWSRGALSATWGSVGMAARVAQIKRHQRRNATLSGSNADSEPPALVNGKAPDQQITPVVS